MTTRLTSLLILPIIFLAGCSTILSTRETPVNTHDLEEMIVRFDTAHVGTAGEVSSGTGFFFESSMTVVSAAHVFPSHQTGSIVTGETGEGRASFRIVALDRSRDMALLQPENRKSLAYLTSAENWSAGESVLVAGYPTHVPGYSGLYLTGGILSSTRLIEVSSNTSTYHLLPTDAFATVGNSGGPVLNAKRNVIGMVQAVVSRTAPYEGATLFVPVDQIQAFLEEHTETRPFSYLEGENRTNP